MVVVWCNVPVPHYLAKVVHGGREALWATPNYAQIRHAVLDRTGGVSPRCDGEEQEYGDESYLDSVHFQHFVSLANRTIVSYSFFVKQLVREFLDRPIYAQKLLDTR